MCPACSRGHNPLALMGSADEVPFCFAGFDALDIPQVVLVPGLTGSPSLHMVLATSSRDTALIEKLETAMFTTRRPDGHLVSRPMATQKAPFDGTVESRTLSPGDYVNTQSIITTLKRRSSCERRVSSSLIRPFHPTRRTSRSSSHG